MAAVGTAAQPPPDRQHEAVAVRRDPPVGDAEPVGDVGVGDREDVVDPAAHQAARGGREVQPGPVPDDAAGVQLDRLQGRRAVGVDPGLDQQHVLVAQRLEVDEGDPAAVGGPADSPPTAWRTTW